MSESIVVQEPTQGAPSHLFLLFHGVGATAAGLVPLARLIAGSFPQAVVASVASPFDSDLGGGRQWFSVRGVTEDNRGDRIAEVMPRFAQTVREWQARFGLAPAATTLLGFSQGAIMSLESARQGQELAARIVSLAGRFAKLPDSAPQGTAIHMIHGDSDPVIAPSFAADAVQRLKGLGAPATFDLVARTGHEINESVAGLVLRRLKDAP